VNGTLTASGIEFCANPPTQTKAKTANWSIGICYRISEIVIPIEK
jgi:hypothetical protein